MGGQGSATGNDLMPTTHSIGGQNSVANYLSSAATALELNRNSLLEMPMQNPGVNSIGSTYQYNASTANPGMIGHQASKLFGSPTNNSHTATAAAALNTAALNSAGLNSPFTVANQQTTIPG